MKNNNNNKYTGYKKIIKDDNVGTKIIVLIKKTCKSNYIAFTEVLEFIEKNRKSFECGYLSNDELLRLIKEQSDTFFVLEDGVQKEYLWLRK